jgi:surface polysaccharide O-acyltransferase-like enzyme
MRLYKIDEIKFICAVMVVVIHVTAILPQLSLSTFWNYEIYRRLLNIAVPFFFTSSGLLMALKFKKNQNFTKYMQNYSFKILTIYLSFTLFYMCFHYVLIISDRLFLKISFHESSKNFFDAMTMKNFINGSIGSYQLWFLTSLLLGSLLIMLFTHLKLRSEVIFLISILLYLAFSTGIITLNNVFDFGGVFFSFLYISMGFYIGNKQNLSVKKPCIGFSISILFYWIFYRTGIADIFLLLSVFYLIVYGIQRSSRPTRLSRLGEHSLNIYILHVFFLQTIFQLLRYFEIANFYKWWAYYPIITILCVVLSIYTYPLISKFIYSPVEKWVSQFTYNDSKVEGN